MRGTTLAPRAPTRGAARPRAAATGDAVPSPSSRAPDQPTSSYVATSRVEGDRVAVLSATKTAARPVTQAQLPLADYMALPVSQYSVLDARRIERLSESTFRCYVDGVRVFSLRVEPVVTVAVAAGARGPTVTLLDARLEGSPAAVAASDRFDVTMTNAVRWGEGGADGECVLTADTAITLRLDVPRWFAVPLPAVERVGSRVMQRVLDVAVPRFLAQLADDYGKWAAGEERRGV